MVTIKLGAWCYPHTKSERIWSSERPHTMGRPIVQPATRLTPLIIIQVNVFQLNLLETIACVQHNRVRMMFCVHNRKLQLSFDMKRNIFHISLCENQTHTHIHFCYLYSEDKSNRFTVAIVGKINIIWIFVMHTLQISWKYFRSLSVYDKKRQLHCSIINELINSLFLIITNLDI